MTNGDRVRSMTDEELAHFFLDGTCEKCCELRNVKTCNDYDCDKNLLNWLREEAKDD